MPSLLGVEITGETSTCNISDAMGRGGGLGVFKTINPPPDTVYGKAVTCETANGDWWAMVKAIDTLSEGDILVAISMGGKDKAIMGELLAHSAKIRGARAIVIDGSVRDLHELRTLSIPIYAKNFVPVAGNPEGKGKVGLDVILNGTSVAPGDIIACDESGVVSIPAKDFKSVIEKAKGIIEKEEKIRKSVLEGKKLAEILNF